MKRESGSPEGRGREMPREKWKNVSREERDQLNKYHRERYQQKIANMTDAELKAFREKQSKDNRERSARKKTEAAAAASSSTAA